MSKLNNLTALGFNTWFESHIDEATHNVHELARVISVHKDSFIISRGEGDVYAELSGRLFYSADSVVDLPTTGDWVYGDFYDEDQQENSHAIIHGIMPRRTLLKRKTAGKQIDYQLIAANIDVAFLIQSLDYNFNLRRLERYLVMVNEHAIEPVILLSKADLVPQADIDAIITSVENIAPHVPVYAFSNERGDTLTTIINELKPGHSYCLLGSSGVGKTSLLNNLIGSEHFETKTVSKKDSKGRHTTTSRELIQLSNGSLIIDTPGMRELANMSVDSGIDETFAEIIELSSQCKFNNCSHDNEKGCAIIKAIANSDLSESRYNSYLKMKKESAFHDMSYLDKKRKDKDLGKLIKATLKGKKNN